MSNVNKCIRNIRFEPTKKGVLVLAGDTGVSVKVTLKVESEDYGYAQVVTDVLTAICDSPETIQKMGGLTEEPNG